MNEDVKRRAGIVGILPLERSILRLIGAVLLERNDEWPLQRSAATCGLRPSRGDPSRGDEPRRRFIGEGRCRGAEPPPPPLIEGEATSAADTRVTPKTA